MYCTIEGALYEFIAAPLLGVLLMVPFREAQLITSLARSEGVDLVFVDCGGNIDRLIPLWLEAGIDVVYPQEVAAGMDPGRLRPGREHVSRTAIMSSAAREGSGITPPPTPRNVQSACAALYLGQLGVDDRRYTVHGCLWVLLAL
jgi:hypothetical protein